MAYGNGMSGRDSDESRELSENMRDISSTMPRMYVERGINRHTGSNARNVRQERKQAENAEIGSMFSEYRQARLRAEAAQAAAQEAHQDREDAMEQAEAEAGEAKPLEEYGSQYERREGSTSRNVSPRKFNRRARPAREWEEDEQPPLLDTIAQAVERRASSRRDFNERYENSRTGASTVRRETENGGAVVRDVEYFVPKLTGNNAAQINYGTRNRKSKNRRPMRQWQKASLTTISLLLVFVMLLGLAVSTMLNRMNFVNTAQTNNALAVQDMAADTEAAEAAKGIDDSDIELPDAVLFDADIENVLLIGSDRRSMDEEGRSDAMMLLTIDRKHKKIKMTSFLRDLYIKIPGKYGTRLNSAYAVGGVDLLKQTIEANLGITVDKYIIIDFTAFKTVVNKIGKINGKGGIKITVTAAEANYMCHHEKYGLFPRFEKGKGTYYMNGAEALNYARIRKIDSDFGRTKRQRKVLTEIINELKDLGYMDLISIGYTCLEYVTTDFTKAELVGLATEAADIMNYENNQISIPVKGSYTTQHMSNGNEVLAANLSVNAKILGQFIYDDDMTYEGNNKEIKGIYLPDLKGIANSNVTTKATTTTTEADSESTTAAESSTTKAGDQSTTTTKAGDKTTTTAKAGAKTTTTTKAAAKTTTTTKAAAKTTTTTQAAAQTTTTTKAAAATTTTTVVQAVG